jgi:hypothetical protein
MMRPIIFALALLAAPVTAAGAQGTGGPHVAPAVARSPSGLARPVPVVISGIAAQALRSAVNRRGSDQQEFAQPSFEGDGTSGSFGWECRRAGKTMVVVNNFEGPVAIVSGSSVEHQNAQNSGTVALQQVSTIGGQGDGALPTSAGGARNVVTGNGMIIQGAGGYRAGDETPQCRAIITHDAAHR